MNHIEMQIENAKMQKPGAAEDLAHAFAFRFPASSLLDQRSRNASIRWSEWNEQLAAQVPGHWTDSKKIRAVRKFYEQHFFSPLINAWNSMYDVASQDTIIANVKARLFTPAAGVPPQNRKRVLINLHAGGFTFGSCHAGAVESIPIAAIGGLKVISVDYRLAPEHRFPEATDDVVAIYIDLLKQYSPECIGIYGCSAGAVLTAQTIARLSRDGLPRPAAVGMLCGGGGYWARGDSEQLCAARFGHPNAVIEEHPYFRDVDLEDPGLEPLRSTEVLSTFPPSLLISSTRDHVLSSVVHTHSRLNALGIPAYLHVWEGLEHVFFYDPHLPESREAQETTIKFFDRHLQR